MDTEPVTSKDSGLATTVYALRGRGLVTTPRQNGVGRAEITEAGTYYLEHGHHPDQPARECASPSVPQVGATPPARSKSPEADSTPAEVRAMTKISTQASASTKPSSKKRTTLTAEELIKQIRAAGGTLRVEDPNDKLRAAYRRAIDAAKRQKTVPAGHHLRYTGRTNGSGDLVVQLADDANPDETSWNRERLKRSRTLTDVDAIIGAVQKDPVALEVSVTALPRALALLRALAEEALSRGHSFSVNRKRRHPNPRLQVDGQAWELRFKEEQKPHVPTAEERRQRKLYSWQRVAPEFDSVPSGLLTLEARQNGQNSPVQWSDTRRGRTLEKQIRTVMKDLEKKAEAARQAHAAWLEERRRYEEEQKRKKAEQRDRWEEAMRTARVKAQEVHREQTFKDSLEQWHVAQDIRAFCTAVQESAGAGDDPARAEQLAQWIDWGRTKADEIDPVRGPRGLQAEDFDVEPNADALRPFLGKWSPHRPEEEFRYSTPSYQRPACHRDPEGRRVAIWTPRSRSMVAAMTWCPRCLSSLVAFSTSSPNRITSARRATNSS